MTHCRYFYNTQKGNHSATLTPTVVDGRRSLPSEICAQSDPPPFEKRRLRPISAHNVSTVGDTTNIKSITGFPTSHRCTTYVTPKCPKGWLKIAIFSLLSISQRLIVLSAVNLLRRQCYQHWWSAAILFAHRRRPVSYTHLTLPTNREV